MGRLNLIHVIVLFLFAVAVISLGGWLAKVLNMNLWLAWVLALAAVALVLWAIGLHAKRFGPPPGSDR